MLNLKNLVEKHLNVSELMKDREKGETVDLINYEKPVTITAIERTQMQKEDGNPLWVFQVKEFPENFFFAGMILDQLFNDLLKDADGDFDELYSAVSSQGIKGKFSEKKTKNKYTATTFTLVG